MRRSGKTWRAWTRRQESELEELRTQGLTAREIALRTGRSVAAVKCRLAQLGLKRARAADQRWLELFARPHTIAGLVRLTGLTASAVRGAKRRLRRAGFAVPSAVWAGKGR